MTSQRSMSAGIRRAALATTSELAPGEEKGQVFVRAPELASERSSTSEQSASSGMMPAAPRTEHTPSSVEGYLDSSVVEELTRRLPTSELVKIIKGALECGRRNVPFTDSDLLRTMTFGSSAWPARQPSRPRSPRS